VTAPERASVGAPAEAPQSPSLPSSPRLAAARTPSALVGSAAAQSVLAAAFGALLSLAFAPANLWFLAILCPAVLMWLWQGKSPRRAAALGFWFGFGTFAAGTYWLYISIHVFGQAPLWLAAFLMIALVAIMGLYHAALGYAVARWLPAQGLARWLVGLPAAWLLLEWWRGWFLSGFSWLSLGLSQTDTWLRALAPVGGSYLVSAVLLVAAGALVTLALGTTKQRIFAGAALVAPWLIAVGLESATWTRPAGAPVEVAVLQGAVPQDLKWLESNLEETLELYRGLNRRALDAELIVWPESAPPDLANNLVDYLRGIYRESSAQGASVVMGVVRAEGDRYFNSVLGLDADGGVGFYDKHHLVPFAEFFPVPGFVRSWLRMMSLPYSDFTRGGKNQRPLEAAGVKIAPTVCYEDAYGSSQLAMLGEATLLVNVTNDAWFGRSTARHQHLQISRMRAIEAGRFMVRAANDGISAVIGPRGEIVARAPEYEPAVLRARIVPRTGLPPYARVGNWPVIIVAAMALLLAAWRPLWSRRATAGAP
jgi:apolipoprotein N-acyltransferase